jgi:hypothetical protein
MQPKTIILCNKTVLLPLTLVGDKKEQPLIIFAENIHLIANKTGLHVNPKIATVINLVLAPI